MCSCIVNSSLSRNHTITPQRITPSVQSLAINHVESQFTHVTEDDSQPRTSQRHARKSTLPKLPRLSEKCSEHPRYSSVTFDNNVSQMSVSGTLIKHFPNLCLYIIYVNVEMYTLTMESFRKFCEHSTSIK